MATKTFYATDPFKYQNRMLTAGDPVVMDGPTSRLYMHLKKISPRRPKTEATAPAPAPDAVPAIATENATPARKSARRRKAAPKK